MAKRSVSYTMGGAPKNRMSNVLAGDDRTGGRGAKRNPSVVRASDYTSAVTGYGSGGVGAPVTRMGAYGSVKDQSRVKRQDRLVAEKPLPAGSIDIRGYFGDERTGIRKAGVGIGKRVAAAVKKTAPSVVRATTNMKVSPTLVNIPGGGLRVGGKSSPVKSAAEARSMKPGNYGSGKVSMGGKTYTGFTVSESKGRSGQTTKSVGNWTSTKDAGRSLGKSGVAGPSRGGVSTGKTTGKTSSSAGGDRARGGGSR